MSIDLVSERHSERFVDRSLTSIHEPALIRTERNVDIVGASAALQAALARARKVAPTESSVLVTGETGTGKQLLARALHGWSRRAGSPFLSRNCGAITA